MPPPYQLCPACCRVQDSDAPAPSPRPPQPPTPLPRALPPARHDLFECLELELPWNNYTTPFMAWLEAYPPEQIMLLQVGHGRRPASLAAPPSSPALPLRLFPLAECTHAHQPGALQSSGRTPRRRRMPTLNGTPPPPPALCLCSTRA